MDSRSAAFLEVMIGIAIVGVLAFVVFILAGRIKTATSAGTRALNIRWPQIVLALVLLIVVGLIVIWQFPPLDGPGKTAGGGSWRDDPDAWTFFIIMLAVAGGAILVFLATLVLRANPRLSEAPVEDEAAEPEPQVKHEAPAASRLLGLFLLVLGVLLLSWIYLKPELQYALMLNMIYPMALAVAVVMLFDKATRSWSAKNGGESFREWILCDLMVFFLILGFLNLLESKAGAKYEALLWDLIHIVAFFLVFWILDRKLTRVRYLIGYLYLMLLPILLLIWQATQGTPAPKDPSWWETIWPLFSLGVIFFVLELITAIASSDREKQGVASIKDALYLVLVAIVLISAVPATAAS